SVEGQNRGPVCIEPATARAAIGGTAPLGRTVRVRPSGSACRTEACPAPGAGGDDDVGIVEDDRRSAASPATGGTRPPGRTDVGVERRARAQQKGGGDGGAGAALSRRIVGTVPSIGSSRGDLDEI